MPGTKPNAMCYLAEDKDKRIRIRVKHASEREKWVSDNREALGLEGTLVDMFTCEPVKVAKDKKAITKLQTTHENGREMGEKKQALYVPKTPLQATSGTDVLLATEMLGAPADGLPENHNIYWIDAKIGFYTKSQTQMALENRGSVAKVFKKVEHGLKDPYKGSRTYGFDFFGDVTKNLDTLMNTLRESPKLLPAFEKALKQVNESLQKLLPEKKQPKVAFAGASILMAFNPHNPALSCAKLIDPDHPIVVSSLGVKEPDTLLSLSKYKGDYNGKREYATSPVDAFTKKWVDGFYVGFANLVDYFRELDLSGTKLPVPNDVSAKLV